jgi:disulfide bond formation protein DsbB
MTLERPALSLVFAGSVGVIAGALLFQYVGGLAPCELCLMERWPYYAAIPLALLVRCGAKSRAVALGGPVLIALVFLASSALAFYHVGVEQRWFHGPTACTSAPSTARTLDELRQQLLQQQPVACDVPQWSLMGVTLAGWNLLASLVLTVLSLVALRAAVGTREA